MSDDPEQPQFVAFDLPASAFPFVISARNAAGEVVWSQVVDDAGALEIPPLAVDHGPVSIRIDYADGTHLEEGPPEDS